MSAGPQRLGGNEARARAMTPREACAAAAERRARDNKWCPSAAVAAGEVSVVDLVGDDEGTGEPIASTSQAQPPRSQPARRRRCPCGQCGGFAECEGVQKENSSGGGAAGGTKVAGRKRVVLSNAPHASSRTDAARPGASAGVPAAAVAASARQQRSAAQSTAGHDRQPAGTAEGQPSVAEGLLTGARVGMRAGVLDLREDSPSPVPQHRSASEAAGVLRHDSQRAARFDAVPLGGSSGTAARADVIDLC